MKLINKNRVNKKSREGGDRIRDNLRARAERKRERERERDKELYRERKRVIEGFVLLRESIEGKETHTPQLAER